MDASPRSKTALSKALAWAARHPGWVAGSAAAATATALWVGQRARRAERDNPPLGRFIEVEGVRLHCVERGSGPAVVLLHGNAVLLQDFIGSGLFDCLSRRHRVVAFDRPGFGHSARPRDRLWTPEAQARLLHRAFAPLGIERPVVLGHSLGAQVALALALQQPQDLRALVLASGYYYPGPRLDVPLAVPPAIPLLGDALRHTVSPVFARLLLRRTLEAMFRPQPVPDDFFAMVSREMMLRPSQLRAVSEDAAFMIPAALKLHTRYRGLQMPVSIFAGAADRIVNPEAHAVRLHRELPQSELALLPHVGHMVHYAAPQRLADAVARLAGLDAPATATEDPLPTPQAAAGRTPALAFPPLLSSRP